MIKRCDHPGCGKAGTCRAPKNRELREYWVFCQAHAAEYNKNWNYYANMTPQEIEADWERQVFGTAPESTQSYGDAHVKFINDFLLGRAPNTGPRRAKNTLPSPVMGALKSIELPVTASWREIGARYRELAKKYHPDAAGATTDADKFSQISAAYDILRKHFGKK